MVKMLMEGRRGALSEKRYRDTWEEDQRTLRVGGSQNSVR